MDRERLVRVLVGARLRQLRLWRNLTLLAAAEILGVSKSTMSRMENGHVAVRRRDLVALLELYGVTDPQQQEVIVSVALGQREPAWWDGQEVGLEESVVGSHEASAALIRMYHPVQVPELLRTEECARAAHQVIQYPPLPQAATDAHVKNLLRRQGALLDDDNRQPVLWAVIEESVLLRPLLGDVGAHIRQLEHLARAAQMQSVTIQVNRLSSPMVPVMQPFTMFRFPDKAPILALHRHDGTTAMLDLFDNESYRRAFGQLTSVACKSRDTLDILHRIRDRFAAEHL